MHKILHWFSRLVTARPWLTIAGLVVLTGVLAAGTARRAPLTEGASVAFLPPGNEIAAAISELDELFGESGDVIVATLVFRGDALTPGGLSQMDALIGGIVSDPGVAGLLAPADPVVSPSSLIKHLLQVDGFESVTQEALDAALRSPQSPPRITGAIDSMTGIDTDGTPVAVATIRLSDTGDERTADAERAINAIASAAEGPLRASSISPIVIEDEYKEATESGMAPLIGLALLLISVLILLFLRALSDLLLTLAGLVLSLLWIIGAEGWLGPDGLGWIGPPSSLTVIVPIIVISLTVDYAIQAVSHYREQRADGEPVIRAVRIGLRNVAVPLVLAAVTTIASFLSTLLSPISVIGDFGVVAGLGVGLSLTVMLTLVPAGRTIIDRRRESRGKLKEPRPVSSALPGIERASAMLAAAVTHRPVPYFAVVAGVTVWLGFAASGLESKFSIRDILPRDGSVLNDMDTLDAAVGGSTELASVLVRAEATETRTFLNVQELTAAFADERRRPPAAAGPMEASYASILDDWTDDSGEPGDKYDPELAALFEEASAGVRLDPGLMQELLDGLAARDPAVGRLLVNGPVTVGELPACEAPAQAECPVSEGADAILLQFPAYTDNPGVTATIQEDIEALWGGDDDAVTATSDSILAVAITDQITSQQTDAISTTVAVALGILALFFWMTLRRPVLGVIAVGPIVLVLIWVLGTMALLGIPYTLITSIVTALSIGIGVDYTIHLIHRYREEFSRVRNPEKAAARTLATTGSALLGSALTTALGFGVLVFAPLEGSQQFGITAAITIAYSLLVSILVVPSAMTVWGAYQNMRLRSMVERAWAELDVAIEGVHHRHEQERQASG